MSRWLLVVTFALNSGCAVQRYLTLPDERVVSPALPESLANQTWRLGELSTHVEVTSAQLAARQSNVDGERLRAQLTERIRSTLMAQTGLGAVEGQAMYSLEVDLGAREVYGVGEKLGLGLGLEAGLLVAGAGGGAGIGAATNSSDRAGGALLGMGIGGLIALPFALLAPLLLETGEVQGEYSATLTLRRRADRVPVATRRLTSTWKANYSAFGVGPKLAKLAGDAVPEFERIVVEGVKSMLLEVNEPVAAAN